MNGAGAQRLVLRINELKKTGARSARERIAVKTNWLFTEGKPEIVCALKGHLFKKDFAAKKSIFLCEAAVPAFCDGHFCRFRI